MASPWASVTADSRGHGDVSDTTGDTRSDSDDSDENGRRVEEVQLIAKKNTTSLVWKYFGFIANEDGTPSDSDLPRCRLCHKGVSAKWSNTSNLISHLKLHHGNEYREVKRAQAVTGRSVLSSRKTNSSSSSSSSRQQTLEECFRKTKLLSVDSKDHRRFTKAVTNYIVKDVVPVYTVDKEGFRDMVHVLNPRYQLPHKDYFSRIAIPSLYEETREQLAVRMKKEANYFSGTADLWSSCTTEPYLCFTVHYVDTQWNLQTHCLQAHYLPEDHTGVQLQDALSVTLEQWELNEKKLTAITTDSASNIKLACQLLKWKRLSCFGHNLDLAINKGLNDSRIERALSICRKVVAAFSSSWKRQRDLKDTQVQKGLPQKKLKGDEMGSKADMVERIVVQLDATRVVLGQDRKTSHLVPTWQDLDVLQSVLKAIEGFKDLTDLMSGEKQITCSAIKPLIKVINDKIVIPQDDDSELSLEIKGRINADLASRYESSEISQLLDVCSFLDP